MTRSAGNPPGSRKALGQAGEEVATRFLEQARYQILARNWRAGATGEADIVAQYCSNAKEATLVFVEVKTRRSKTFGQAVEAVDERKQRQMIHVAQSYLAKHFSDDLQPQVRFDVITVLMQGPGAMPRIEHWENAFTVDG